MSLCVRRVLLLLLACVVTPGTSSVRAEPTPGDSQVVADTNGDIDGSAEPRRPRCAREVPESMVLCRGPRGAVYAARETR